MNEHDPGPTPLGSPQFDAEYARGFIGALMDLSFETFVTPKVIQLVYGLLLLVAALWTVFAIATAFAGGAVIGVVMLLLSPVLFLLCVLFIRMYLELVIILFRIYEILSDRPL